MSTAPRHTPWHVNEYDSFDGRHLARILTPSGQEIGRNLSPEHAAFIVLAVNNHEKLLAAAKGALAVTESFNIFCPQCGTQCNRVYWQTKPDERYARKREWECPNQECGYAWAETQNPRTFRSIE